MGASQARGEEQVAGNGKVKLIAIDDDPESLRLVEAALCATLGDQLDVLSFTDPVVGLEAVRRQRPEGVLLDLRMPTLSGMEVLERIVEMDRSIDVLLLSAHDSAEAAVEAIQKGACDYLTKPIEPHRLQERVSRFVEDAVRRRKTDQLDGELLGACRFEGITGRSPAIRDVCAAIRRVAPYFRNVLISGPTGSGKELVAKALHRLSPVGSSGPFIICNCAALTETLIENELFGHARGAFTGAVAEKAGFFEMANGGTLFLDEIGEMSPAAQAKVLRAVQNQEIQRVGSATVRKVQVRIVAATNRDLAEESLAKRFREDLFYRLSMIELKLPSMADRKGDLPLLMREFVDHFSLQYGKQITGVTRKAEAILFRYSWPGNVRELENTIDYACMVCDSARIDVGHLPERILRPPQARVPAGSHPLVSLEEMDRMHARAVVEQLGGDKAEAAAVLGVSRATLYRLLAEQARE
jgi:DNA-binding NtrC family response regulator